MAENAEFAQKVIDSGIIWIGPKPNTLYQWVIKI